jgi:hypothetical protein
MVLEFSVLEGGWLLSRFPTVSEGDVLSHAEMIKAFHVGASGGIRYRGTASDPDYVLIITSEPGSYVDRPDRRRPYRDRWEGDTLKYTGEGRYGPQRLEEGNLALYVQPWRSYPPYVVQQIEPDMYRYLGSFEITAFAKETQPGEDEETRTGFVFSLHKVA